MSIRPYVLKFLDYLNEISTDPNELGPYMYSSNYKYWTVLSIIDRNLIFNHMLLVKLIKTRLFYIEHFFMNNICKGNSDLIEKNNRCFLVTSQDLILHRNIKCKSYRQY